ncbi:MAG: TetR/AcrR family transcriptional regulator, partial [Chloroflexota bacterium]
ALTCFAGKGYYQTTMDDIVTESGLSKGSLYWHFKSKQELFIALVEWFFNEVNEDIFQAWTEEMSAADKIRSMMMTALESSGQLIPFFNVFLDFWARTSADEQLRQLFDRMIADYQARIGGLIEEGMARGEFRPVNGSQLSLAIFGVVDALFLYQALLGEKIDARGSATTALDVILAGLKAE